MKKFASVFLILLGVSLSFFGQTHVAQAHEVYVLDQSEIAKGIQAPPPDFIDTIKDHLMQFSTWGVIVVALMIVVFLFSISLSLERLVDPYLMKIKTWAPHIAQVTVGLAIFASGYYHAFFGTELAIAPLVGIFAPLISWILISIGMMFVFGIYPRIAALVTVVIFAGLMLRLNIYMLNYFTYFGEAIAILIFGGAHSISSNKKIASYFKKLIPEKLHVYKFLIMRIFFGISLIYASLYAKLIHGDLALEVVMKYHLTNYFHFDPLFLVLGAMLVEVALGLCFMIGFEIRFASIFFLVFLTMSLLFFGETVWPHIVLIGTALAMFTHGYDKFTVLKLMKKQKKMEPIF